VRTLRLPGVLIVLGYVGIATGTVAWLVALGHINPWEFYLANATPTAGFALAGFACWWWIVACRAAKTDPRLQRVASRLMSAASVITAAGWAAVIYFYYQNHQSIVHSQIHGAPSTAVLDPHYRLRMAGGASIAVGLLLAGIGFWIASSATRSAVTESVQPAVAVP
jgi:hypothetical protein